jgi:hypothetical protein
MPLNTDDLLRQMLEAAKPELGKHWSDMSGLATSGFKNLSRNLADIAAMKEAGTITEEQALLMIDLQKNALKTLLLTEKGLGLLTVQNVINAALGVVRQAVNTAIGWPLL